jgi:hypothetical protein
MIANPKSETRNQNEIRNSKLEIRIKSETRKNRVGKTLELNPVCEGLSPKQLSDFGFPISDFPPHFLLAKPRIACYTPAVANGVPNLGAVI